MVKFQNHGSQIYISYDIVLVLKLDFFFLSNLYLEGVEEREKKNDDSNTPANTILGRRGLMNLYRKHETLAFLRKMHAVPFGYAIASSTTSSNKEMIQES